MNTSVCKIIYGCILSKPKVKLQGLLVTKYRLLLKEQIKVKFKSQILNSILHMKINPMQLRIDLIFNYKHLKEEFLSLST
jgi:hypothetical protein